MLPTRRQHIEFREINGITFDIQKIECMEYNGSWLNYGYEVSVAQKKIHTFFGYPLNSDIWTVFEDYRNQLTKAF